MKSIIKYMIFRHDGFYAVTTVENYYSTEIDAKKISCGFHSPQEIIESYGDWFNTAPWDFAISIT